MINRDPFLVSPHMTLIYQTKSGNTIWLGDYNAALDLKTLRKFEIRAVLTVAAELDLSYSPQNGIKHKIMPVLDMPSFKIRPYFSESRSFILQNIASRQNILVHCEAGISRSAAIVIAFLMQKLNLPFKRVYTLLKNKRHLIDPNYGFKDELVQYEKKILGLRTQTKGNESQPSVSMHVNHISEYLNNQRSKESSRLQSVFRKKNSNSIQSQYYIGHKVAKARVSSVSTRSLLPRIDSHR